MSSLSLVVSQQVTNQDTKLDERHSTAIVQSDQSGPSRALAQPLAQIGSLINAIGKQGFSQNLDALTRTAAAIDITAIFAYPPEGSPVLLHNGIGSFGLAKAMDRYLRGTFLLDAVYQACVDRKPEGLHRLSGLAPDHFFSSDYSVNPDVHPCLSLNSGTLAEELVYLVHLEGDTIIAYSVMRRSGKDKFTEFEFAALDALTPIVVSAIQHNWKGLKVHQSSDGYASWSRRGHLMEVGFETFAADRLSTRERLIVRLMLQGHSATSISTVLSIAEGTVKNHKKSIYFKMQISSQSELFAAFVNHVCK
jgi:DNA-binding CsgD family transcriptional regulator